jgi:hypothetical protein
MADITWCGDLRLEVLVWVVDLKFWFALVYVKLTVHLMLTPVFGKAQWHLCPCRILTRPSGNSSTVQISEYQEGEETSTGGTVVCGVMT